MRGMYKIPLIFFFKSLGSIYFIHDNIPGCQTAEVVGDVPASVKDDIRSRFVIGPTTMRGFWEKERSQMRLDRGPCETNPKLWLTIST